MGNPRAKNELGDPLGNPRPDNELTTNPRAEHESGIARARARWKIPEPNTIWGIPVEIHDPRTSRRQIPKPRTSRVIPEPEQLGNPRAENELGHPRGNPGPENELRHPRGDPRPENELTTNPRAENESGNAQA